MQEHIPRHGPGDSQGTSGDQRYRSLFENVPIGLYITTPEGTIVDANPALVEMLGYANRMALLGKRASELYADPADRILELSLFDMNPVVENHEARLVRADGELIWVRDTYRAVRGKDGRIDSFEGSLQDITAEKQAQQDLAYMARHDPLTGLYNRHTLRSILASEMARAERYEHPLGVLMMDVNGLKQINDQYGHAVGDEALIAVAGVLRDTLRETDVPVRFGGDEFLVLLIETNGETDAVRVRLHSEMARRGAIGPGGEVSVSLAIGAAHWAPSLGTPIEGVISQADEDMYRHKIGSA